MHTLKIPIEKERNPNMNQVLHIAVDGHYGSRKTMTSRWLASEYNLMMVDSGLIYCFAVLQLLLQGKTDPECICADDLSFIQEIELRQDGTLRFRGKNYIASEIRTKNVLRRVAQYAQIPALRRQINDLILESIEGRPAVVNGRDIGTVVLPHAPVKFFMYASLEYWTEDLRKNMIAQQGYCDEEELRKRAQKKIDRDRADQNRQIAPMVPAEDAIYFDLAQSSPEQIRQAMRSTVDAWLQAHPRPVLSVLIPTYNRASIVKTCLDKLLSYPIPGLEFVVCNDASQDDTAQVLASYDDPRVSVYHNRRNGGASYNSHLSFVRARGKYALLISDEDDLFPESLAELVEYLRRQDDIAVYIAGGIRGENDIKQFPNREYPDGFSALWQLGYCTRYMTGIIFRTDLYREVIGRVSYEEAPHVFNVYSFMYAMAKLFFHGRVLTSDKLIFQENRFTATTLTNNIKNDPDTFYFEPKGRISQIRCSVNSLSQLPITQAEKIRMLYKIYYDTAQVSLRPFDPAYLPRYQQMIPERYQMFLSHIEKEHLPDVLTQLFETMRSCAENCGICTGAELEAYPEQDAELAQFVQARQQKIDAFLNEHGYC